MPVNVAELYQTPTEELVEKGKQLGIDNAPEIRPADLAFEIARILGNRENLQFGRGVLEVHSEGFGFLRNPADNYLPGTEDIYVSQSQIRRFKLQTGDTVVGQVRDPKEGERYFALLRVEAVNGDPAGEEPPSFESLTAIYPDERIALHTDPTLKAIDMVAPMGLGQRGILVAPSRTGRVEILRALAAAMGEEEELDVTVLLLDERPEEIQEWRNAGRAEVIATPFDEPPARTLQVADIVFERARRRVERGDDVVLLVDSLTRLLRACLAELPHTGREMGGIDTAALHRIRRYMGAARALEEGGSLTVIGVVSGDVASRTDATLLEDLRDVVNWELYLDRDLADRGIRPPIDVHRSGTRRVERLLDEDEAEFRKRWRAGLPGEKVEDGAALVALVSGPTAPAAK